jgi:hypothetical protein
MSTGPGAGRNTADRTRAVAGAAAVGRAPEAGEVAGSGRDSELARDSAREDDAVAGPPEVMSAPLSSPC